MNDHPNRDDGSEDLDVSKMSQPSAGSLPPVERNALARRPAWLSEPAAPADREPTYSGGGVAGYLHAYRRHWFLATSVGLVCGAAAAAAIWFSASTSYTSFALIRVAAEDKGIVYQDDKTYSSFELYKGTQIQLLTSDFVLMAALRDPKVANIEVLKREEDSIRWLARALQVEAPGNAEILRLSLSTPDRNSGAVIVQAVVDAYFSEVVDKEHLGRVKHLAELDGLYTAQETEVRSKRTELAKLEKQLGSGDKGVLSLKEQSALQEYMDSRKDLKRVQGELQNIHFELIDLDAKRAALKAGRVKPVSAADIEAAVRNDQECTMLRRSLAALRDELSEAKSTLRDGALMTKTITDRYARMKKSLEGQLADRRQELAEQLQTAKGGDSGSLEAEAEQLKARAARLTEQEQEIAKQVAAQKQQTDLIGNSSIDVEMLRAERDELEKTFAAVADQRERARVELNSQARISVPQPASLPQAPDKSSRLQNAIVAGGFGFLAPVGLLLWWDVRRRRINSVHDISRGLGLQVIGAVPHITGSAPSGARRNPRRQRQMQICLDQSIDGIVAKLCLRADSRNARVVLVSSATRGEGKSTLSIQLAKRLAWTSARTLLVDFDLRKPTLHHVFDAPRGPGLSEYLRGESELGAIIRPTEIDNLSLLTAGSPFFNSLGTLANGVTRSLFEKVREEFEFVVVDGSPILPVVDALLASQHVDSVVLSIRRDVSQVSRVQAACDQLAQFGVEEFVAVLTGSNEDLYYYDGDHEHLAVAAGDAPKPR